MHRHLNEAAVLEFSLLLRTTSHSLRNLMTCVHRMPTISSGEMFVTGARHLTRMAKPVLLALERAWVAFSEAQDRYSDALGICCPAIYREMMPTLTREQQEWIQRLHPFVDISAVADRNCFACAGMYVLDLRREAAALEAARDAPTTAGAMHPIMAIVFQKLRLDAFDLHPVADDGKWSGSTTRIVYRRYRVQHQGKHRYNFFFLFHRDDFSKAVIVVSVRDSHIPTTPFETYSCFTGMQTIASIVDSIARESLSNLADRENVAPTPQRGIVVCIGDDSTDAYRSAQRTRILHGRSPRSQFTPYTRGCRRSSSASSSPALSPGGPVQDDTPTQLLNGLFLTSPQAVDRPVRQLRFRLVERDGDSSSTYRIDEDARDSPSTWRHPQQPVPFFDAGVPIDTESPDSEILEALIPDHGNLSVPLA